MTDHFYRIGTRAGKGRYIVNDNEFDELVEGLTKVRSKREIKLLLSDLLTRRELAEIIRRWLVGRMLLNGMKYDEIIDRTGMADKTIAEIGDKLLNGTGMLFKAIERTSHHVTTAEHIASQKQKRERDAQLSPIDKRIRKALNPFDL